MFKNTKAQTNNVGLILGLIFGIASLVIAVIISFVIVSTLTDANLLTAGRTTETVVNETGGYINSTGYQLAGLDSFYIPGGINILQAYNGTDGTIFIAGNYSVSSTGIVTNATVWFSDTANFTYTNSVYSSEEQAEDNLAGNFTTGVDNVSSKIPTVLLIAAIVLILGVLVLLVGAWQRMRIGGGSI